MKDPKAQKLIQSLVKKAQAEELDIEGIAKEITELREIALKMEDPLVVKTLRLVREKLEEDEEFDVEPEVDEEDEEFEMPENHLEYLFQLIQDSENKFNREEIKYYRTALMNELY